MKFVNYKNWIYIIIISDIKCAIHLLGIGAFLLYLRSESGLQRFQKVVMLELGFQACMGAPSTQSVEKSNLTRENNPCKGTEAGLCELMARVDVQAGYVSIGQMIKALSIMLRGLESIPLQGKWNNRWLGRPLLVGCGNGPLEVRRSIRDHQTHQITLQAKKWWWFTQIKTWL